jgi:Mg/Co/Ni transporter MgtE
MSSPQQRKVRQLLQYHPTTAGGMMNPDFISVTRGTTFAAALDRVRKDDKAPHQLLNTVFVTESDGRFVGSVATVDLLRGDQAMSVENSPQLSPNHVLAGADIVDVTLMMTDYNLMALAVTDATGLLIGAVSIDDIIESLVPEDWRSRVEASTGV